MRRGGRAGAAGELPGNGEQQRTTRVQWTTPCSTRCCESQPAIETPLALSQQASFSAPTELLACLPACLPTKQQLCSLPLAALTTGLHLVSIFFSPPRPSPTPFSCNLRPSDSTAPRLRPSPTPLHTSGSHPQRRRRRVSRANCIFRRLSLTTPNDSQSSRTPTTGLRADQLPT